MAIYFPYAPKYGAEAASNKPKHPVRHAYFTARFNPIRVTIVAAGIRQNILTIPENPATKTVAAALPPRAKM